MIVETISSFDGGDRQVILSRPGVATMYEIKWMGQPATLGCDAVEPSIQLSCRGEGQLNLLDMGPNDNALCSVDIAGSTNCAAKQSGVIYAECRDGLSNTPGNREIIVKMSSTALDCTTTTTTATTTYLAYHSMWLKAWCNSDWVSNAVDCSGKLVPANTEPYTCYQDDASDILMRSTSYQSCTIDSTSRTLPTFTPDLGQLSITGNDGNPSTSFPLQVCQGDCDSDTDCVGTLRCMQRTGNEIVPGCIGSPEEGRDYCVVPSAAAMTEPQQQQQQPDLNYVGNSKYILFPPYDK